MIPITGVVKVVDYDPNWPEMFEAEAAVIKQVLGDNCVVIHHVGSTSVPGLSSKPVIDIICGVNNLTDVKIGSFEQVGFTYLGEFNVPMRMFFIKRTGTETNLHIFESDNSEIELNILFRNYLYNNPKACSVYAELKKKLVSEQTLNQNNSGFFSNYTLGKNDLIREFLLKAGFSSCRLMHCAHYSEWDAYHKIKEEQIFKPISLAYDRNHPTIKLGNHFHFVLYKGVEIVSAAHVEFLNNSEAALRSLATDESYKNQGFGRKLVHLLERWIKYQGRSIVKVHAALRSEGFYRKMGYSEMIFDDESISKDIIDLGKLL